MDLFEFKKSLMRFRRSKNISPRFIFSIALESSEGSNSVNIPRPPKFIPKIGICGFIKRTVFNIVPSPPTVIMHFMFESSKLSEIDTVSKFFEINGEINFTWNPDRVNFFAILIADLAAIKSESLDIIANESICLLFN